MQSNSEIKDQASKVINKTMDMSADEIQSHIQDTLKTVTTSLKTMADDLREYSETMYEESVAYAKKNPGKVILGIAAVGLVVGAAVVWSMNKPKTVK